MNINKTLAFLTKAQCGGALADQAMHVQCSYLVVLCFSSSNYLFHQNLEVVECSINKYTNDVINPFLTKSKFATNLKNKFFLIWP